MAPQCSKRINKYDRPRFISYDANEWEKEAMGRHLIKEFRLALTEADGEQIQPSLASIKPCRWIKFAQNPGPVVSILVREFYANMDVTTNTSTVRDLHPLGIEWHVDIHGQRDWFTAKNLSLVAKPPLHVDHTLHGVIIAENMPHPGIQQNHEFVPRVFDPEYADIDMALKELIEISKASVGSRNVACSSTNKE
ncbi:hypothetical protein FXO38_29222 [Capsicum annuum]|uniref:Uncharacterized protein n=1 Tax=Capsicum annuum TaxID=4072 RepID=A0A2G2Y720_CAPAN|nr:hypothetical protein FXO38_29222 [Capsicum annuum]KAF3635075.1 hypothetical protein FXO37_26174 [Capsicum annuum]PHT65556.1 hypothetical protein T459_29981 [Capsicum annuum]